MPFQLVTHFAQDPAKHFDTLQIHAGLTPTPRPARPPCPSTPPPPSSLTPPRTAPAKFALAKPGNVYGRLTNTTTDAVAARVAAIEGGTGAVARRLRPRPRRSWP